MYAGHPWARVDELLDEIKQEAVALDELPESIAMIFHDGKLSALLSTPTFFDDTADHITDVLCDFLPRVGADQIVVSWPAVFEVEDGLYWAMKANLWQRSAPHDQRMRVIPVPLKGTPDDPWVELEPSDPWSQRLARALAGSGPKPFAVDVNLPDGFALLVSPDAASFLPCHSMN